VCPPPCAFAGSRAGRPLERVQVARRAGWLARRVATQRGRFNGGSGRISAPRQHGMRLG